MKNNASRMLLVHPPVASPAAPPWISARVAAVLSAHGVSLDQYDANLDFFSNQMLNPTWLSETLHEIEKRKHRGVFEAADSEATDLVDGLGKSPSIWKRKIASAGHCRDTLKSESFFHPEFYITARKDIEDLLALSSLAFYPSRIRWDRFENPAIRNRTDVKRFTVDPTSNPFLSLCEGGLEPRLIGRKRDFLVFTVETPAQVLAALTMARFTKRTFPRIHVILLGDSPVSDAAPACADSFLPQTDLGSLLELIGGVAKHAPPADRRETTKTDFSGLPLKDYLAPFPVLPARILSTSGTDASPPPGLMRILNVQAQQVGAKALFIEDPPLPISDVATLAREMTRRKMPVCLGITCALSGFPAPGIMNLLFRSGIRFIRWRIPSPPASISELGNILWHAAKAGIWNHVEIPEARGAPLPEPLTHYITANPTIAHSWKHRQSVSACFASPALRSDTMPPPYGRVADLPGRPFWQDLHDPAHMLLYLNRHGLEAVLRWRVEEKGLSIHTLGKDLEYHFVRPEALPPSLLDEICRMVEAGGSVTTQWVRHNLERAFLIGYVMEQGVIVANSSLKHPRTEYVKRVKRLAGLDISDYLERGYTSVRPEYRGLGIGTKLLEGLTARVGKKRLFSIITADNVATRKIALRNKTKQVASFYSERLGKEVGVWVPEWMIEDGQNR